ncbi:hypothetical protein REPUB_Repub13aG0028200 [Reevesia pubescens]
MMILVSGLTEDTDHRRTFFAQYAQGYWRKAAVVSWIAHCPGNPEYDFHKYMIRTLEVDFKKVVGISWYLWLFVVVFLLLNVKGWHTYFWLSFLPVVLLLLVGTKLEHIIIRLAQDVDEMKEQGDAARVKPSNEHFWFSRPGIVLHLIHFILFQNAFEISFFFWILFCEVHIWIQLMHHGESGVYHPKTYNGCNRSSSMQLHHLAFMGSKFKKSMFTESQRSYLDKWRWERKRGFSSSASATTNTNRLVKNHIKAYKLEKPNP